MENVWQFLYSKRDAREGFRWFGATPGDVSPEVFREALQPLMRAHAGGIVQAFLCVEHQGRRWGVAIDRRTVESSRAIREFHASRLAVVPLEELAVSGGPPVLWSALQDAQHAESPVEVALRFPAPAPLELDKAPAVFDALSSLARGGRLRARSDDAWALLTALPSSLLVGLACVRVVTSDRHMLDVWRVEDVAVRPVERERTTATEDASAALGWLRGAEVSWDELDVLLHGGLEPEGAREVLRTFWDLCTRVESREVGALLDRLENAHGVALRALAGGDERVVPSNVGRHRGWGALVAEALADRAARGARDLVSFAVRLFDRAGADLLVEVCACLDESDQGPGALVACCVESCVSGQEVSAERFERAIQAAGRQGAATLHAMIVALHEPPRAAWGALLEALSSHGVATCPCVVALAPLLGEDADVAFGVALAMLERVGARPVPGWVNEVLIEVARADVSSHARAGELLARSHARAGSAARIAAQLQRLPWGARRAYRRTRSASGDEPSLCQRLRALGGRAWAEFCARGGPSHGLAWLIGVALGALIVGQIHAASSTAGSSLSVARARPGAPRLLSACERGEPDANVTTASLVDAADVDAVTVSSPVVARSAVVHQIASGERREVARTRTASGVTSRRRAR